MGIVLVMAMTVGGCSNLGLGEADCTPPERDISSSTIMTMQAVPTAKYTPCLDELRLGWDEVVWFAENGRAGIEILAGFSPFLTATVTESCDTSAATKVPSGRTDIERFEDVHAQTAAIQITVIPTSRRPLTEALRIVLALGRVDLDDRPAAIEIDEDLEAPLSVRIERGLRQNHFVWIIDELGAEEGTLEMRSDIAPVDATGITATDALEIVEDHLPDQFYRGYWYFTFEGGCITYEFDAEGPLAESVAQDADDAFGFYPAHRVRRIAEGAGYNIVVDED